MKIVQKKKKKVIKKERGVGGGEGRLEFDTASLYQPNNKSIHFFTAKERFMELSEERCH